MSSNDEYENESRQTFTVDPGDESWQPIGTYGGNIGVSFNVVFARKMSSGEWEFKTERINEMSQGMLKGVFADE